MHSFIEVAASRCNRRRHALAQEHCAGELKGSSERRAHHCEAQRSQRERDSAARREAQALASAATMRFLHLVRPVMGLLPEVVMPDRKIP